MYIRKYPLRLNNRNDQRKVEFRIIFNNYALKPDWSWVQVVPPDYLITIDGVDHVRLSDPSGKF